jgi:uncharacterized membrane protein YsdA (DUF1294 family)
MPWWLIAILGGIVGIGIGVQVWRHYVQRPLDQSVRMTAKRHAELLDLDRRQQDER